MNEQTCTLESLLKEGIKQDAHDKKMEANLAHIAKELEAVKVESKAVIEELHKPKQQIADAF
jgi:hypothetical protein